MRDGSVMADSDLVDFLSGPTDSAINFNGSADLHTPIHPPQLSCGDLKLLLTLLESACISKMVGSCFRFLFPWLFLLFLCDLTNNFN